jgi:hypothetical protein
VAFWYQNEPHKPFPSLLPVAERLPRLPEIYDQLTARERDLNSRFANASGKFSVNERHQIRIHVLKPIATALWAENWEQAAELLDKAATRMAQLESV